VLAIKSGRTHESDLTNMPPTPGITNRDIVFDAAFSRAGVVRVNDSDELSDELMTLSSMRPLKGDRLAIFTNSLGPAQQTVDKLVSAGCKMARFSKETHDALQAGGLDLTVPGDNPVDLGGDATPERFVEALELVASDPGVDAVLVVHA